MKFLIQPARMPTHICTNFYMKKFCHQYPPNYLKNCSYILSRELRLTNHLACLCTYLSCVARINILASNIIMTFVHWYFTLLFLFFCNISEFYILFSWQQINKYFYRSLLKTCNKFGLTNELTV